MKLINENPEFERIAAPWNNTRIDLILEPFVLKTIAHFTVVRNILEGHPERSFSWMTNSFSEIHNLLQRIKPHVVNEYFYHSMCHWLFSLTEENEEQYPEDNEKEQKEEVDENKNSGKEEIPETEDMDVELVPMEDLPINLPIPEVIPVVIPPGKEEIPRKVPIKESKKESPAKDVNEDKLIEPFPNSIGYGYHPIKKNTVICLLGPTIPKTELFISFNEQQQLTDSKIMPLAFIFHSAVLSKVSNE